MLWRYLRLYPVLGLSKYEGMAIAREVHPCVSVVNKLDGILQGVPYIVLQSWRAACAGAEHAVPCSIKHIVALVFAQLGSLLDFVS